MSKRALVTAIITSLALAGCSDDGTGLEAADLEGTWVASVYEYIDNADALNVVDLIQRDGASFTLTVEANGTASTLFDDGLGSTSSDSGTLNSAGTTLTLSGMAFDAVRIGNLLNLTNPSAQFDFGSGSATSATLRIVLNRN